MSPDCSHLLLLGAKTTAPVLLSPVELGRIPGFRGEMGGAVEDRNKAGVVQKRQCCVLHTYKILAGTIGRSKVEHDCLGKSNHV